MIPSNDFIPQRPLSKEIAWCPGCGNFGILNILKKVFSKINKKSNEIAIISGIGQAAKIIHYINVNGYHSLHGRSIPIATAVKIINPEMTVIAEGGDGDMYAEGFNHLVHAIRRNIDITVLVHNNQIYGLTKGQASPTTPFEQKTPSQPYGVKYTPLNAIAIAITLNCSFVARTFMGYIDESVNIIIEAIKNKGLSFVEIFHPCVTFNRQNDYKWYKDNTAFIKSDFDPFDKEKAYVESLKEKPFSLGIIYKNKRNDYNSYVKSYENDKMPIYKRNFDIMKINSLLNTFK